ncbi:hypothetical protein [Novosphingobium sp. BL-52-GroH]|uniref:hypothetical protein n=1 Tax=Novosphingobium sp. BL-52-GroH TaxID=3349877 RepID=UPI00384A5FC2
MITFRIKDDAEPDNLRPVMIAPLQMGALRETLTEYGERYGHDLIIHDYGSLDEQVFAWEARTAMMPIAMIARHFTFDVDAIALIETAQYLGRRLRIARRDNEPDIVATLSTSAEAALEMNVSNSNAYAILAMLGLDVESCGTISIEQLRRSLADPVMTSRLDAEPGLARYLPALDRMAAITSPNCALHMV